MANAHDRRFDATRPGQRFLRLAGMTAQLAGQIAKDKVKKAIGNTAAGEDPRALYRALGRQLATTLGEMKGAVMKVGQIASQFKDVLPNEIVEALESLQKSSPPMPYPRIAAQIRQELGAEPEVLFAQFDKHPYAAASIGQVHRARTHQGQEVVVKVQYPGVDECVDSDLKHLRLALKFAGLLRIDKKALDHIFAEIRRSLEDELDYRKEADNARLFADFHRHDEKILIPAVHAQLSSQRVLTLDYIAGDDIHAVTAPRYDQVTIDAVGHRLFGAIAAQIYQLQAVHCDPHAGNFAFRPDGSLIIYDYGCVKRIRPEIVTAMRQTAQAAIQRHYENLDPLMIRMGVRNTHHTAHIDGSFYADWSEIIMLGFASHPLDFRHSDLHERLIAQVKRQWSYWPAFQPSPDTLLVQRAIGGHYWTMRQLGVVAAFRQDLEHCLATSAPD